MKTSKKIPERIIKVRLVFSYSKVKGKGDSYYRKIAFNDLSDEMDSGFDLDLFDVDEEEEDEDD